MGSCDTSWSSADMCRAVKNLNIWASTVPADVKQGDSVSFLFLLSYYKQIAFSR